MESLSGAFAPTGHYDAAKTQYVEASRKRGFLDALSKLPRPHVLVEDAEFLACYSLESQSLTLNDVLSQCSLPDKEPLEEFPCQFSRSEVFFQKVINPAPDPQMHLDQEMLAVKQKQLHSLLQLYESEIQWLSCSSRLWFGQLRGQRLALLLDTSDSACTKEDYLHYVTALQLLVMEQLSSISEVHMMSIGSEVYFTDPKVLKLQNNARLVEVTKDWLATIGSRGSCNLLAALKEVLKIQSLDTICIVLCSEPDQDFGVITDYLVQKLAGKEIPLLHVVAINTAGETVQKFLRELSYEFKGHYHHLNLKGGDPDLKDTQIDKIVQEKARTEEVLKEIEWAKSGRIDKTLLQALKDLSLITHWPGDDTFTPPSSPSHIPPHILHCSSSTWLTKYGIEPMKLDLYQFLSPDAYSQLNEFVPIIEKTATSCVYDVMPKFTWNDGSCKYLHVNVHRIEGYIEDMKLYIDQVQKRVSWLLSGGRVPFGAMVEKQIIFLLDTSSMTIAHLSELQQHLKMVLHEQIGTEAHSFNIYDTTGARWSNHFACPDKDTLANAWKWVLNINPNGTCNLLASFKRILEDRDIVDMDNLGIYVIISTMPDQEPEHLCEYIEQRLTGTRIKLHVIFYQPTLSNLLSEMAMKRGSGQYGDKTAVFSCLKQIAEYGCGTFHHFAFGIVRESTEHSQITTELSKAEKYLETAQQILSDYRVHCRRNVPLLPSSEAPCSRIVIERESIPVNPRPTLTSVARLNSTYAKLKEYEAQRKPVKIRMNKRGPFQTAHCFYLGRGLKKGLYLELFDLEPSSDKNDMFIPTREEAITTEKWLSKYSLKSLRLFNDHMFEQCANGYKHVTSTGSIVELSFNHQQLIHLLRNMRFVRERYKTRLKWLLSGSRLTFGCIAEKKVVILIDNSSSMGKKFKDLQEQLKVLIDEQLCGRKCMFNIVSFATAVKKWQTGLTPSTPATRTAAKGWIQSLTASGSSGALDALKVTLVKQNPQAVYLITDGEANHSHKYIMSQLDELQKKSLLPSSRINTIAYHCGNRSSAAFLQTLAHRTEGGRYHCYPLLHAKVPDILEASKSTIKLSDDIALLRDEIEASNRTIQQLLHYLGRSCET